MKTFVFCGQGSQIVGMGKDFFDEFPDIVKKADDILGYSIKNLCINDYDKQLNMTSFTQPALYVVSILEYLHKKNIGEKPDFLLGHSIGEYAALYAAGVFSFEDGLKIVKQRGELMFKQKGGGMNAIIGLSGQQVEEIIKINRLDTIDIANYNTPSQIAISGPIESMESCKEYFIRGGAKAVIPLKVSGAFHSRYLISAQNELFEYIKNMKFVNPQIPVISNFTGRPYENGKVKNTLIQQLSNSVQWVESIRYLMTIDNMDFVQIGPGNVTINLVKSVRNESIPLSNQEKETCKSHIEYDVEYLDQVSSKTELTKSIVNEKKLVIDITGTAPNKQPLGNVNFMKTYNSKYAYAIGSMCSGISGADLVVSACNGNILSFLGTNGLSIQQAENMIIEAKRRIRSNTLFGINITKDYTMPQNEVELLGLCQRHNVSAIEISNFMSISKELVLFKTRGLRLDRDKQIVGNRIMAKISQSFMAEEFLSPPPIDILNELLSENSISKSEYDLALQIPVADDVCVVGDGAYETERNNLISFLPEVLAIRKKVMKKFNLLIESRVGAAGGIGSQTSARAIFYMGADFILTGSINQCTIEANVPNFIKDELAKITSNDVGYAPSEKLFELGKEVQVLKKGTFFPARSRKLKSIYDFVDSLDMIQSDMAQYIQEKFFKSDFETVFRKISKNCSERTLELATKNDKYKMALVFKEYLNESFTKTRNKDSNQEEFVDFEIYCSKALGALNEEIKNTKYSTWRERSVVALADYIMGESIS